MVGKRVAKGRQSLPGRRVQICVENVLIYGVGREIEDGAATGGGKEASISGGYCGELGFWRERLQGLRARAVNDEEGLE